MPAERVVIDIEVNSDIATIVATRRALEDLTDAQRRYNRERDREPRGGGGSGGGSGGSTFQTSPAQFTPATSAFQGITTIGMAERIAARGADAPVNIVVNGGISTSAEIGQAVVNAIRAYNRSAGPAQIQVA